ncbi:uncharacterized protein CIMG_04448 [Coccidioides immitis RS]|uniref:Uncharacterized protein n=2 Tax=Coccidioides immitis TaxID=5501 RepID=A0A0E1RX33_COCIM|nr:uncharacterized protein CIMG_04448 [Coccidioides immitis RS]EAS33424.2 hypothetical protein CIMG_04448 [Coccidioides immitis RS]KMP04588.1 hypothetical protein CIRG_04269 [Coccidioides immitis RMSCC 2394]
MFLLRIYHLSPLTEPSTWRMTRSLSGYIPRPSTSLDKIISSTGLQVTAIKSSLPQRWLELMFAERQS